MKYPWNALISTWNSMSGGLNFGIAVLPTGGLLGFRSSNSPSIQQRPLLTVDFTPVPEPTSLAMLAGLGLTAMRRRR